jgi:hypothetical protein
MRYGHVGYHFGTVYTPADLLIIAMAWIVIDILKDKIKSVLT